MIKFARVIYLSKRFKYKGKIMIIFLVLKIFNTYNYIFSYIRSYCQKEYKILNYIINYNI